MGLVRTEKDSKLAMGTYFLERVEARTGQIQRKSEPVMDTYVLERTEVGTSQDIERN